MRQQLLIKNVNKILLTFKRKKLIFNTFKNIILDFNICNDEQITWSYWINY